MRRTTGAKDNNYLVSNYMYKAIIIILVTYGLQLIASARKQVPETPNFQKVAISSHKLCRTWPYLTIILKTLQKNCLDYKVHGIQIDRLRLMVST